MLSLKEVLCDPIGELTHLLRIVQVTMVNRVRMLP